MLATVKGDVHDIGKNIVGVVLACNNYEVIDMGVMVPCEKILERAKAEKADLIGLSGLITPSLDEMAHVAREMERQGFKLPLLIGGATTSRAHTAVKIAPHYSEPVVHVLDASRAVPGHDQPAQRRRASRRSSPQHRAEYEELRKLHGAPAAQAACRSTQARANRTPIEWRAEDVPTPEFTGRARARRRPARDAARVHRLDAVLPHLGAQGRLPAHPRAREVRRAGAPDLRRGERAARRDHREEAADRARRLRPLSRRTPSATTSSSTPTTARGTVRERFHFLRQQASKADGEPNRCLGDFVAPRGTDLRDHIGGFAVTTGIGLKELCERFQAEHDDYNAIMAEALADRLAEAFAEYLHKRVRDEWGYGRGEDLSKERAHREKYRGIRPAAGYPACPDHTEKGTLWRLLDVEKNTGMQLTESFAMWPGSSVSGLYFAHPESRYFALGKIDRDQVADYRARKGMTVAEVERWLGPNLNYDPGN